MADRVDVLCLQLIEAQLTATFGELPCGIRGLACSALLRCRLTPFELPFAP